MSGDKRWTVGVGDDNTPSLSFGSNLFTGEDFVAALFGDDEPDHDDCVMLSVMWSALVEAVADAARLRSLAARMDSHLNRGRSFTGAEVAAMLRDGGPADDSDIMPGSEFDGPVVL